MWGKKMLKPETAHLLTEAGYSIRQPGIEELINEILARGWRLLLAVSARECQLQVYDLEGNAANLFGSAGELADLVGRALLFVLNRKQEAQR